MEFCRVQAAAGSSNPPEEVWEVRAHLSTHGLLAHQLTLGLQPGEEELQHKL